MVLPGGAMKVLITGGAGFIGSHIAERYIKRGDHVCILDNLSTGSLANVEHLTAYEHFKLVIGCVTDRDLVYRLAEDVDVILHLAAAVGVRLILEQPTRSAQINLAGTEVALSVASELGKRVLITSTSEVYGKRNNVPFSEEDDLILGAPSKLRWSYACSKLMDEFLALAYCKEKGASVVIARLFNIVGPRQTGRYGMVVPTFTKQALRSADITVYGDGSQTRSFLHVQDAATALMGLAEYSVADGEVYNVGSAEETSILQLAHRIRRLADSSSQITLVPYSVAYSQGFEDMPRRVPLTSKINAVLGFTPTMSLDGILSDVIQYHRSQLLTAGSNGKPKAATAAVGQL
jgi:UDP-glucose 4-epimerase